MSAPAGSAVTAVVEVLARALTDRPDEVRVTEKPFKGGVLVELYVGAGELGRRIDCGEHLVAIVEDHLRPFEHRGLDARRRCRDGLRQTFERTLGMRARPVHRQCHIVPRQRFRIEAHVAGPGRQHTVHFRRPAAKRSGYIKIAAENFVNDPRRCFIG